MVTEQVEVEEVEVFRVVSSSAALALAATACTVNLPHLNYTYTRCSCCLVMEYIPGGCLFKAAPAWAGGAQLAQTAEDLGRLFTLDMLLGNADRLHCDELGWRGNPGAGVGWGGVGMGSARGASMLAAAARRVPGPSPRPHPLPAPLTAACCMCALQTTSWMRRGADGRGEQWPLMLWCSGGPPAASHQSRWVGGGTVTVL